MICNQGKDPSVQVLVELFNGEQVSPSPLEHIFFQ